MRRQQHFTTLCRGRIGLAASLIIWLALTCIVWGDEGPTLDNDTVSERVNSPRDMLRVMRIDDSQLRFIQDDRPLMEDEAETLLQMLFRIPSFSQVDVEQWTRPLDDWQALVDDPSASRFELFELHGEVVKLTPREVIPEMVPRLRFKRYFELTIQSGEHTSLVLVRLIPKAWHTIIDSLTPLPQSVRFHAMLLKRTIVEGRPGLVFIASRVRWHPAEASPKLGVDNDQVLLGQLGLDVSRLDDVQHKQGMHALDRECFYQLLAAVRLAEPEQLAKLGRRKFDLSQMINTPEEVAGRLFTLGGRARRAVLVQVDDPDIQSRFGIDHYYEIEVFLPLEKNVRFVDRDDPRDRLFTDYPFVICVPELPESMAEGADIHVSISFSGFFMKLWAYRTEFMTGDRGAGEQPRLQLSPLLIGPTVLTQQRESNTYPYWGLVMAALFTTILAIVWVVLWRTSVGDRKFAKARLFRDYEWKGDAPG